MININLSSISICCLSLRRSMNLRKSRFSSEQKRNQSRKDVKSSVKKRTRNAKRARYSQKSLSETPLKTQKSVAFVKDIMEIGRSSRSLSNLNLLTSTPIPKVTGRRTTRSSDAHDLDEMVKLRSFNRLSCPITSSPIQKTSFQTKSNGKLTKPCEIRLIPVMPRGQRCADEGDLDLYLRSNKKTQDVPKKTLNKKSVSKKSKSVDKNSVTEKRLGNNQKSIEGHIALQNKSKNKECVALKDSLVQSFSETGNSKSRYSLRSSFGSQRKSSSNKKINDKKSVSERETDTSISSRYSLRSSIGSQKKSHYNKKIKKKTLPERETETFRSSGFCSQLENRSLSERASVSRLISNEVLQDVTQTNKNLIEPSAGAEKRSRCSLRLKEVQLSKKPIVNQLSKETAIVKQKTKKRHQSKKSSSYSKKQMSSKKSVERRCLSMGDASVDDLALSVIPERRKVQSDGFKAPCKNILKRKRSALEAKMKADEDYEDDIFEKNPNQFDYFKDIIMDTSDSEISFAVSTPKFPSTPLIRHKTPKFKDCFSPKDIEIKRNAALKYIHSRNARNSGTKPPKTPVIAEKKKLEYSQVLENAQELQKVIDNLADEESDDDDSYFSF